jgi:hypothetical protein
MFGVVDEAVQPAGGATGGRQLDGLVEQLGRRTHGRVLIRGFGSDG